MKIQIKQATTIVEEKELDLQLFIKISKYEMCKVLSDTEMVEVWAWHETPTAQIFTSEIKGGLFLSDYEIIPESEFQSHLNKAKQIIDKAYNKAVVKSIGFGERNDYEVGEVVVWNGQEPCICKLAGRANNSGASCYKSYSNTHDSLHYRHLRPATPEEIELLGENKIHYL
jgi:hypothetical protein